jgi:hypothetical protein
MVQLIETKQITKQPFTFVKQIRIVLLFASGVVVVYDVAQRTNLANWKYYDISCNPKNQHVRVEFTCASFDNLHLCFAHRGRLYSALVIHLIGSVLFFQCISDTKCRNTCDIVFVPNRMALSCRLRRFLLPWFVIFMFFDLECFVCLGVNMAQMCPHEIGHKIAKRRHQRPMQRVLLEAVVCLLLKSHLNLSCPVKSSMNVDLFDQFEFWCGISDIVAVCLVCFS